MSQEKSIETVENGSATPIQGQPLANIEAIEQVAMVSDKVFNRKEKDEDKEVRDSASNFKTAAVVETHSSSIDSEAAAEQSDGAIDQDVVGYNFVEGTSTEDNGLVLGAVEDAGGLSSLSTLSVMALGVLATTLSSNTDEHRSDGAVTYVAPPKPDTGAVPTTPSELKIDFNSGVIPFEGASAYADNKNDANGDLQSVYKIVKPADAQPWAGATIYSGADGDDLATVKTEKVTMKIHAAEDATVTLKLEAKDPTVFKEINSGKLSAGWNDVEFDLTGVPEGTIKASVFPDLMADAAGQEIWIDDVVFPSAVIGGKAAAELKVDFNSGVIPFEGASAYADNKNDANGDLQSVYKIVKPADAQPWAGATLVSGSDGTDLTVDNAQKVTMKVYAAADATVTLKLEAKDPTVFKEINSGKLSAGWNDVEFDLTGVPEGMIKASLFPDLMADAAGQEVWVDDLVFPDALFIA